MSNAVIKSFCLDFNWDLIYRPAAPGLYGHADPARHLAWYQQLGANVIQTFCVSYNGHAWYRDSEVAPVTPNLTHDFLPELTRRGHQAGMKVMGYFCLGSNMTYARNQPNHCWHDTQEAKISHPQSNWLPFTTEYLDYFCASIRDALRKTEIDGFMIDWFRTNRGKTWLDNEKVMWAELMGEPFPSASEPNEAETIAFERRQIERAWDRIKQAVADVRPAVIWTNHPFFKADDPRWNNHRLLREVDWILNESPDLSLLTWLEKQIGPNTKILQCLTGWDSHRADLWEQVDRARFGFYGFSAVHPETTLPWTAEQIASYRRPVLTSKYLLQVETDSRNVELMRQAYHKL